MDSEVEDVNPRGRPNRTCKEVIEADVKNLKVENEDSLVCSK